MRLMKANSMLLSYNEASSVCTEMGVVAFTPDLAFQSAECEGSASEEKHGLLTKPM